VPTSVIRLFLLLFCFLDLVGTNTWDLALIIFFSTTCSGRNAVLFTFPMLRLA
jgi:hypothetical protein